MSDVSSEQINNWKQQYKEIFKIVLSKQVFVYRNLNIKECESIQFKIGQVGEKELEDLVLKTSILYPEDFNPDNYSAVLCTALSGYVLKSVGLFYPGDLSILLSKSQKAATQLSKTDFFTWKATIMQVFPGYTFEILDKLIPFEFFKLIYICESMTGKKLIGPVGKHPVGKQKRQNKPSNTHTDTSKSPNRPDVKHIPNEYIHDKKVKMLSNNELNQVSVNSSVQALQEHWNKVKGK